MNSVRDIAPTQRVYGAKFWLRIAVVLGVGLALAFVLDVSVLRFDVRSMPQLMTLGIGVGIVSLMVGFPRACIGCFALSASMAYQLRSTTVPLHEGYAEAFLPGGSFDIEQYSTSNIFSGDTADLMALTQSTADVVSVQGLSPDWASALSAQLHSNFPYQYLFPDIGVHGIGLFAKTPLGSVDSMLINGIVQVKACLSSTAASNDLHLMAVQTVPPVSNDAYLNLQAQLDAISAEIKATNSPIILVGDFNAVPWSPELNRFSYRAGVRDSRRCQTASYEQGTPGMFEAPVEHIFYNARLSCVRFETLRSDEHYIGNRASFQPASTTTAQVVEL